jgi:thiol-disulfide isomerase/thioredoxin
MPERLVLVAVVALAVLVAVFVVRAYHNRKLNQLKQAGPAWGVLGAEPDGRRTVIAFSTPSCAACHRAQAPAIDLARQRLGGDDAVRVIKVDASKRPNAARAFGILTVPSTVVLAAGGGRVVAVNQGFTPSGRLVEQLQQA